ncbi:MAG: hypothetical protein WC992_07425 [Acholeplasmataceae bacterium]
MTAAWDQTALVVATVLNVNRDPKKGKPVNPDDINPYRRGKRREVRAAKAASKADLSLCREAFEAMRHRR